MVSFCLVIEVCSYEIIKIYGVSWVACASFVHAHTPYLAPLSFEENRYQVVTLDAAFAEQFFIPDVVFDQSVFKVNSS